MKIWVPKFKIIEPKTAIALPSGMAGRYKLTAVGPLGVRRESPWFDNLILDAGLNRIGASSDTCSTCAVGTGNTAPTVADTQLGSLVASTTTLESVVEFTNSSSPYGGGKTWTYRFAQGAAEGNLAEVGIGWGASTLFSRALIEDGGGSPTTFPVQSDEFLDVTYQLTAFPPLVDVEDSIDISGSLYDIVLRGSRVNSSGGWAFSAGATGNTFRGGSNSGATAHAAFDGSIGAITGSPSGSSDFQQSQSNDAYSADSFQTDYEVVWGLSDANFGGGITAVRTEMASGGKMEFQCSYSPAIPKDDTNVLTLNFRHAWARS